MAAIDLGGFPYSQIGQLQIRSRSGTIPSTIPRIGGWAVDPVAECAFVEDAGLAVPSTAVSIGALKYTPDGALYVTADTTTGPFTNIGGLKVRQDGAACIITKTPSVTLDPYIGGAAYDGATQAMVVGGAGFGFILPLITTVRPTAGVGGATFTRATTATLEDWEQNLIQCLSGEVRFQGARRVRNKLVKSEDLTNATYFTPANVTVGADGLVTTTAGAGSRLMTAAANETALIGSSIVFSARLARGNVATAGLLIFDVTAAVTRANVDVTIPPGGGRVTLAVSGLVPGNVHRFYIYPSSTGGGQTVGSSIFIYNYQVEETTGQSNTNPSEYVSVGVLSAPYHGANVDGVKYFATQNGNTVASNVVTEATGAAISASIIKGYLAEGARTNLCLQSQAFDNASWTKTDTVITADNATAPDGTFTADLATEGSAGTAFISQGSMTIVAGTTVTQTVWVKRGNFDWLLFTVAAVGATTGFRAWFNLNTGVIGTTGVITTGTFTAGSITAYPNGWYRLRITGIIDAATTTSAFVFLQSATADASGTRVANGTYFPWGAQFEAASFASSYIPTTTVAVTRNADVLTYASAGNLAVLNPYSIYAEAQINAVQSDGSWQVAIGGSLNYAPFLRLGQIASSTIDFGSGSAPNLATYGGLTGAQRIASTHKYAARMDGTNVDIFADGFKGTGSVKGAQTAEITVISIGLHNGGSQLFGTIKNVMISQSQLTDAQLSALTA